jgi:hypothetical protein
MSKVISKTNYRDIQPQILPRTVTRLHGEQLVISFPKGWRYEKKATTTNVFSPKNEAKAAVAGFRGFKTLSNFENWLFSSLHYQYEQVGCALIYIPYKQVGIGRRFAVNKLDIVIREYQDASKHKYLGAACVRIRNTSVSVVFKAKWDAIAENRKIFERSVQTVRFVPKNLL